MIHSHLILQLTNEIRSIDEQIASLREARELLAQDKQTLLHQQKAAQATLREKQRHVTNTKQPPEAPQYGIVDYSDSSQFKWKKKLDGILDRVFGIKKLRLCQEGVLNAVLDNRDVICIMPVSQGFIWNYSLASEPLANDRFSFRPEAERVSASKHQLCCQRA